MKNKEQIYYTGIGSNKSGISTQAEFLRMMNQTSKRECAEYIKSLKCKSCKDRIKLNKNITNKTIKNKNYKPSKKTYKKLFKLTMQCIKCSSRKTKKCDIKQYMKFSGANFQ